MPDMFFKVVTAYNTYFVEVDYWEDESTEDFAQYYSMRIYDEDPNERKGFFRSGPDPIWEFGKVKAKKSPRIKATEVIEEIEAPYKHQEELEELGYVVYLGEQEVDVDPQESKAKYAVRVTDWDSEEKEKIIYLERKVE